MHFTYRFECKLDDAAFGPCGSPHELTGLADGEHTFQVRSIDPTNEGDTTPASRTWTVDTTAPDTSIDQGPAGTVQDTDASFTFSSSESGSSFACRLDGAAFAPCDSPQTYSGLTVGDHRFDVRATDVAGNVDASPASGTWTISSGATTAGGTLFSPFGGDGVVAAGISRYDIAGNGLLDPLVPTTPLETGSNSTTNAGVSPDGRSLYVTRWVPFVTATLPGDPDPPPPVAHNALLQYDIGPAGALSAKSPATVALPRAGGLGSQPSGISLRPDGSSAYVTDQTGAVYQLDVDAAGALTVKSPGFVRLGTDANGSARTPAQLAITPAGDSLYVATSDGISQFDIASDGRLTAKAAPKVDAGVPVRSIVVSPDGAHAYASEAGAIRFFSVGSGGALVAAASVPVGADRLAIATDGRHLYATGVNVIRQLDVAADGTPSSATPPSVPAAGVPRDLVLAPGGGALYALTGSITGEASVLQYTIGAGGLLTAGSPASAPTGVAAFGLAVAPPAPAP